MPAKNGKGRQARRGTRTTRLSRALPPASFVPSSRSITMTYSNAYSIAEGAAGAGVAYFFRLNSVYDPDATGVGTTPMGYANWAALFLNYKVRKCTVRVQGTATAASGSLLNVTLMPVPGQAVIPANKFAWRTIHGAQFKTISPQANGGRNMVDFVNTYDIAKVAGITKQQFDSDMDFSGAVGSNPARMMYLGVGIDSVGSGTLGTLVFSIQITYLVEWFNPVPMQ